MESQLAGNVLEIVVKAGDAVDEGDPVLIIEAMKMEIEVTAHTSGTVASVNVAVGDAVGEGQAVASIA